jgi:hypothetical protein
MYVSISVVLQAGSTNALTNYKLLSQRFSMHVLEIENAESDLKTNLKLEISNANAFLLTRYA